MISPTARVLLLCGPSGSGKSRLANRLSDRYGWPIVRLDDFYKSADDPSVPASSLGIPDWDTVESWQLERARDALADLCATGRVEVPLYDISSSSITGRVAVVLNGADTVIAEGIFAAELIEPLRQAGVLRDAFCIRQNRWVTMTRRFARDVAERRKPVRVLARRGVRLARREPALVADQVRRGARALTPAQAERAVRV